MATARTLALGAALLLAACAGSAPKPQATTPVAARAPASGAISGQAPLGVGTGASGVVDEGYLYDQHARARQASSGKGTPAAPRAPWASGP